MQQYPKGAEVLPLGSSIGRDYSSATERNCLGSLEDRISLVLIDERGFFGARLTYEYRAGLVAADRPRARPDRVCGESIGSWRWEGRWLQCDNDLDENREVALPQIRVRRHIHVEPDDGKPSITQIWKAPAGGGTPPPLGMSWMDIDGSATLSFLGYQYSPFGGIEVGVDGPCGFPASPRRCAFSYQEARWSGTQTQSSATCSLADQTPRDRQRLACS